ncbi:MAG TPA: hypothetical protein VG408_02755 [Actinomycetota bacterium]|nr:hypothetical protein [Actinomycetota bacterium]
MSVRAAAIPILFGLLATSCAGYNAPDAVNNQASTEMAEERVAAAAPSMPADASTIDHVATTLTTPETTGKTETTVTTFSQDPPAPVARVPRPRIVEGLDGPGVTDKAIRIGVTYDPTMSDRYSTQFGGEYSAGNHIRLSRIVAKIVNRAGGISGRRIRIVPWIEGRKDPDDSGLAEWERQMCDHFTGDKKVFAVLSEVPIDHIGAACLAARGTGVINGVRNDADHAVSASYGNVFATSDTDYARWAKTYVAALHRRDFFKNAQDIGLVSYADPVYQRVIDKVLVPELAERSVVLDRIALLTHPKNDPSEVPDDTTLQASATMAEFRDRGIDHVLFFEGAGPWASGSFTHAADKSGYDGFRYGLSTHQNPGQFIGGLEAIPDGQLRNAIGIGWSPLLDLRWERAIDFLNATAHRWVGIFRDHGVDNFDECCVMAYALQVAERMLFLRQAIEAIDEPEINLTTFAESVEELDRAYRPLLSWRTDFGPRRHAGAALYRDLSWLDSCDCWSYRGPLRRFAGN